MKCFYHSADLDGHCSGAIIKYKYRTCDLVPINYGDPFPWDIINYKETVYMVDFSLQPFSDMIKLKQTSGDLIWIDHHKTAIQAWMESNCDFKGIRIDGQAGCELVWDHCFTSPRPRVVNLLGRYDVWDHDGWPDVLPFQYGLRLEDTDPRTSMNLWRALFEDDNRCSNFVLMGETVLRYESQTNTKFCKAYAFETLMPINPNPMGDALGSQRHLRAICANKGFTNSKLFDSLWNPEKYAIMITFCRLPMRKGLWTVSLYSDHLDVDCGAIAKAFGGGGHKGAAGFQCQELPFEI